MGQPNAAAPQRPMAQPQQPGGPLAPQMRQNWQDFLKSLMDQHNATGPQRRMAQPKQLEAPQRPMAQPNQARPERPMARPNRPEGQTPPSVQAKPPVQADQPPVARIRALRQAVEHLSAAGYAEQAAKGRQEISRMEAELKQTKPAAPAPTEPRAPRAAPRRDLNPAMGNPQAPGTPDANAAMLNEMRNLHKQIEELSARVRKYEAPNAPRP